ncbi:MAG: hypothetical protein LBH68_07460, partial [Bifidobacteriaceae bacterium]|nr:hypothetical protein [Bifidobacteriaceae bacterium]
MALFKKRSPEPEPEPRKPSPNADNSTSPDQAAATIGPLASLDQEQSRWLVTRFMAAMEAGGFPIEEVSSDGALKAANGFTYHLDDLAQRLALEPAKEWDWVVKRHMDAMMTNLRGESATPQQIMCYIAPRLVHLQAAPPEAQESIAAYGREIAPNLHVIACLDLPLMAEMLFSDESLEPLGGWQLLYPHALGNLRKLPGPVLHNLMDVGEMQGVFHAWESQAQDYF